MKIDISITKILTNWVQIEFTTRMQDCFKIWKLVNVIYTINKLKTKRLNYINRCRKSIYKVWHLFWKILSVLGVGRNLTGRIILKYERMNASSQDQKQDKVSIILFNFVLEIVLKCNKARKSNKKQLNMKAISKTVFIHRKCNCLCRKSNWIYNKATRTNEFRELQNIRAMHKNQLHTIYQNENSEIEI